jgi:uncharacterized protein (TIGR01777 family)
VGRRVVRLLLDRGDEVLALTRDPSKATLPDGVAAARFAIGEGDAIAAAFADVDAVVNLAGEPVLGRRWNDEVREEIRRSRVEGTRTIVAAMRAGKPRVLVNSSAVGYYGPRDDAEVPEDTPPADDFLGRVCVDWEAAAREVEDFGGRAAMIRTGIVLDPDGGALPRMLPPFRWFVGGPIGNGRQGFPWIHHEDHARLYLFALDDESARGPLNGSAPCPLSNRDFSKALGRALHRPAILPVPGFALRLLLGEVAAVLTKGQMAVPARPLDLGFEFRFPDADAALADLVGRR